MQFIVEITEEQIELALKKMARQAFDTYPKSAIFNQVEEQFATALKSETIAKAIYDRAEAVVLDEVERQLEPRLRSTVRRLIGEQLSKLQADGTLTEMIERAVVPPSRDGEGEPIGKRRLDE